MHVSASINTYNNNVNFNHIIEHALSCTLEENTKHVSNGVGLRFETMDEVLNVK